MLAARALPGQREILVKPPPRPKSRHLPLPQRLASTRKLAVSDAQAAALLMAIFLRGLNPQELAALTQAMRFSGETLDTSPLHSFTVDKHSTGGVGDKTSLLIAPIIAAPPARRQSMQACATR
jgi:hypothetical protein